MPASKKRHTLKTDFTYSFYKELKNTMKLLMLEKMCVFLIKKKKKLSWEDNSYIIQACTVLKWKNYFIAFGR